MIKGIGAWVLDSCIKDFHLLGHSHVGHTPGGRLDDLRRHFGCGTAPAGCQLQRESLLRSGIQFMLRNISLVVLFLLVVSVRAESVSLGTHGSLELAVPEGWQLSSRAVAEMGRNIQLTPKNGANARCLTSVIYQRNPKPIDKAAIEHLFRAGCERFVSGSVEQKTNLKELPLSPAYGLCATFTDASLVGQPPKVDDYKVMTNAMIQFNDEVSAAVTVLTDDEHGTEQQQLIQMFSGLKIVRAKGQPHQAPPPRATDL